MSPHVSFDGTWLGYVSNETGELEVYVRRADGTGGRYPVSSGGGWQPRWSPIGHELFYRGPEGLYSAELELGTDVRVRRELLFDDTGFLFRGPGADAEYDVHPDGDHFLMIGGLSAASTRLNVIVNWIDELRERVGELR